MGKQAKIRLICLPYAGGGSAIFYRWQSILPPCVQVVPICLPGREHRLHESPQRDLRGAVSGLVIELQQLLDRPWALLGHSMGAWLGFELIRDVRRRGMRQPELLIPAASRAPHLAISDPPLHQLPDDEFVRSVNARYQGMPAAVLDNAELLQSALPALRADLAMIETYRYIDEPPLDVETLVLGGSDDSVVSASQLAAWRRHTTGKFSSRLLPGGHFFLFQGQPQDAGAPTSQRSTARLLPAWPIIVSRLERLVEVEREGNLTQE